MRSVQSTLFALLVASSAVFAETQLNLTPGVSPISHDIYELHMTIFWICVVIGVLVFGAMFYAMFYHRKSRGAVAAHFHSHPWLEVTWTIVPAVILVLMAVPATKVLFTMNNNEKEALTIKITGYQWKWHYEYLEDELKFFSNLSTPPQQMQNKAPKGEFYLREVDHPIVVPIHKKIRFLITSNDVNHAWWVPDLGVKRDAIAGFINEAWTKIDKPGTYRGQCAELCGINHAFMPIVVIALSEQGYKDWVAQQKGQATQGEAQVNKNWTMQELMTQGEQVYGRICSACHQPGGLGLPPTFPALKGSKVTIGAIEKHIDVVMNGVSGTAMQAFKSQLSDVELAGVITYERNAWGNSTNSMVQPIQMKAYRGGKTITEALQVQPTGEVPAAAEDKTKTETKEKAPASVPAMPVSGGQSPPSTPVSAGPSAESAVTNPPITGSQPLPTTGPTENKQADISSPSEATNKDPGEELKAAIARGEQIYLKTCAVCHQPGGTGMPPVFPALKNSPITLGPVAGHIDRVLHGKPGTTMQAFQEQLSDQEIADVVTYERNAWGHNLGKLVTADEVKAAHQAPTSNNMGVKP